MAEILWLVLWNVLALVAGVILWAGFLFAKNRALKRQIYDHMHDKGMLTMRCSILEDILKERRNVDYAEAAES